MIQTLLVALGLSMDAFAVSVSAGMCNTELKPCRMLRASFSFGLFQFLMPVFGWFLGRTLSAYIQDYDHWIAFGLLALVGGKMLKESLTPVKSAACEDDETVSGNVDQVRQSVSGADIDDPKNLLVLSIATSLDALAIGISFSLLGTGIWTPALVIGVVTFFVCMLGFEFGKRIGSTLGRRAETVGGLVLIGIGVKILVEHQFFN
jgi:putative Mn2+ efflux pump MntP